MTKPQRIMLFSCLGLLLLAFILLTGNRWLTPSASQIKIEGQALLTWQAFPTRGPQGTSVPQADDFVSSIHLAILRQDFKAAEALIKEAENLFPEDVRIWQHKTRLAVTQGHYVEAEELIWQVIGLDPTNATNWAFAGTIFTHNDKPSMADQSLSIALQLNPDLAPHLFRERWKLALLEGDPEKLTELADEYYFLNPEEPLAEYYLAEALRATEQNSIALNVLVNSIERNTQSPALLWFALGQAYLERGSYQESVTALEHAQDLFIAGDKSMLLAANEPDNILRDNLAKSYLGAQRCVSAEALFRRLAGESSTIDYSSWITKAVTCQTPTPTPTHWMLSLQGTATPSP